MEYTMESNTNKFLNFLNILHMKWMVRRKIIPISFKFLKSITYEMECTVERNTNAFFNSF